MTGWAVICASLGVTIGMWLMAKVGRPATNVEQAVSQILGLLGIISLSWTYILAIRHKTIEKLMGGLDKVYKAHHILGGIAFVLVANHVAFLILAAYPMNQTVLYLIPGKLLSYTLGQLAFYLMLLLLSLTLYINLPYRYWKWTHEWMGIVIILGGIHSILVSSDTTSYPLLGVWIGFWSILATCAYLYKRFIYYVYPRAVEYTVETNGSSRDLQVISLKDTGNSIKFGPGQYGFFSLTNKKRDEHPFSVLSSGEHKLILGIKVYGNFTAKVRNLKKGDKLMVRGPFGMFAEKMKNSTHMVWVAGGIGITPFLSMANALSATHKTEMYFCAKIMPHPVLTASFVNLTTQNPNFRFLACETSKSGRLTGQKILVETGGDKSANYFLCGPKLMMESIAEELARLGVRRSHIIYEDFAFK